MPATSSTESIPVHMWVANLLLIRRYVLTSIQGPTGRARQPAGTSQDSAGFYSTIMNQSQQSAPYDDRRSKRQSRISREFVSSQDTTIPAIPTAEWQDQLYRRLTNTSGSVLTSPVTSYPSSSEPTRYTPWSSSDSTSPTVAMPTSLPGMSGEPSRRRRRLDTPYATSSLHQPNPPTYHQEGAYIT